MRGATLRGSLHPPPGRLFQSTRPMRGATFLQSPIGPPAVISIHAPHAGRDASFARALDAQAISIHAPHAGRDCVILVLVRVIKVFQSTRPMRGATHITPWCWWVTIFQSTRPMRGATVRQSLFVPGISFQSTRPMRGATSDAPAANVAPIISIHAPHAGRDSTGFCVQKYVQAFQSTRPMRGATTWQAWASVPRVISIHAPHAGRDKG